MDASENQYATGWRPYRPDIGRFSSLDPAGSPNGPNRYNYCSSEPVNNSDPDGLKIKFKRKNHVKPPPRPMPTNDMDPVKGNVLAAYDRAYAEWDQIDSHYTLDSLAGLKIDSDTADFILANPEYREAVRSSLIASNAKLKQAYDIKNAGEIRNKVEPSEFENSLVNLDASPFAAHQVAPMYTAGVSLLTPGVPHLLVAAAGADGVNKALKGDTVGALKDAGGLAIGLAIGRVLNGGPKAKPSPVPQNAANDSLYARGTFRKSTHITATAEAPKDTAGNMLCPTCDTKIPDQVIQWTKNGPRLRIGYDLDHYGTTWSERISNLQKSVLDGSIQRPTRDQILDLYNENVRVQCPSCNQGHGFEGK